MSLGPMVVVGGAPSVTQSRDASRSSSSHTKTRVRDVSFLARVSGYSNGSPRTMIVLDFCLCLSVFWFPLGCPFSQACPGPEESRLPDSIHLTVSNLPTKGTSLSESFNSSPGADCPWANLGHVSVLGSVVVSPTGWNELTGQA